MGFFDIQVNGYAGVDFQQPHLHADALLHAVRRLAEDDVDGIFLTLITDRIDALEQKFTRIESLSAGDEAIRTMLAGYHLEGPWLSPEPGYCGAHRADFMGPPKFSDFQRLQNAAGGRIRMVTLAPEWEGSTECIRALCDAGVHVSLGHTNASMAEIEAAVEAGARFCTHLGNGVPIQIHRHDNIIQRLLSIDELTAFFIPDGIHLPPFLLKNMVRVKPLDRVLFTTDCMAAAGAPPGRYPLAGHILEVGVERIVRMPGSECFAGSALTAREGVHNVSKWCGISGKQAEAKFGAEIREALGIHQN